MRLELFDVSRRWPRQRTQSDDEVSFVNSGIFFTTFCSIRRPYITFKLPRGDMDTPPRLRNFFRYLAIGVCHFRYLWNGLCDRHRAEITVVQFSGHSLPVHHSEVGPSPCPILSAEPTCAISFNYWPLGCVTSAIFGMAGVIVIEWNNYHAVYRSLSSGALLFLRHSENFYLVSYCEPSCILHSCILKQKPQPPCLTSQTTYTVKHILIECRAVRERENRWHSILLERVVLKNMTT